MKKYQVLIWMCLLMVSTLAAQYPEIARDSSIDANAYLDKNPTRDSLIKAGCPKSLDLGLDNCHQPLILCKLTLPSPHHHGDAT